MKDVEVELHIDDSLRPVNQPHRRIPFHQRKSLEACVESLFEQDIIEPAIGPTPYPMGLSSCPGTKTQATRWCSALC